MKEKLKLLVATSQAIWRPFGEWVHKRREERGFVPRDEDAVEDA